MRENWWKILGILLVLHALLFGLLTPLKPGIPAVYPTSAEAGRTVEITIDGYNTHFQRASNQRVWLQADDHALLAEKTQAVSDRQLKATFRLPEFLPFQEIITPMTLVVNNESDGTAILPSAVFVKQADVQPERGAKLWTHTPIEQLYPYVGTAFPYRNLLGETIRNLYYHVSLWFAMFIILGIALFYSVRYLRKGQLADDLYANSLITVGVVYGLLGCVTGSIWARYTWGTWWTTDVKLNMAAVFMLIYLAYFVMRGSFTDETKRARLSAVYNIFGFVSIIPLLFVIPRLVDSLHPGNGGNPGFGGEDLDNTMRIAFYPAIIGMTLLGIWMSNLGYRLGRLRDRMLYAEG